VDEQQHASIPLGRVRAVEGLGDFLYHLKAGPAGGLRPPSRPGGDTTVTGEPASPCTPAGADAAT
jgi:hypothetical protein